VKVSREPWLREQIERLNPGRASLGWCLVGVDTFDTDLGDIARNSEPLPPGEVARRARKGPAEQRLKDRPHPTPLPLPLPRATSCFLCFVISRLPGLLIE
jgi:hypothetical protein